MRAWVLLALTSSAWGEPGLAPFDGPDALLSLHHRAVAHWGLAQHRTAAEEFQELLAVKPDAAVQANLGLLFVTQRRYEEALAVLEEGLLREPRSARLRYLKGRALLGADRAQEAEEYLQEAALLDPQEPAVAVRLAEAYEALGRGQQAEQQLRRVLDLRPRHPTALNRLGRLLERRGAKEESSELLARFAGVEKRRRRASERCRYDEPLERQPGPPAPLGPAWLEVRAVPQKPGGEAVATVYAGRLVVRRQTREGVARFELGDRRRVDALRLDWPDGTHSYKLDVETPGKLVVKEVEAHVW